MPDRKFDASRQQAAQILPPDEVTARDGPRPSCAARAIARAWAERQVIPDGNTFGHREILEHSEGYATTEVNWLRLK